MPFKFFNKDGQELQANLIANMPIGSIIDWATDTPPAGWLKCDGSAISRTDYADLFNTIGTAYGTGNGTTTFNVPDITGSIIYASLISRSGSSLLPVADGSVTTAKLADSSVTAPKIDATVAGYLGLTSGSTTRRWTVNAATERTTTSASMVDVTSASLSINDVAGNLVVVSMTANIKGFGSSVCRVVMNVDVPTANGRAAAGAVSQANNRGVIASGIDTGVAMGVGATDYAKAQQTVIYTAPDTRTTTAKLQFLSTAGDSVYVKDVVINAWAITP